MPDLRGVLAAVAAGAGVTVLPRYLCVRELTTGALVPLLDPEDPPINTGPPRPPRSAPRAPPRHPLCATGSSRRPRPG